MPRSKLVGKTVLIGLADHEADGTLLGRREMFGTIVSFDQGQGIQVRLDDGSIYFLPPDKKALRPAAKGEYHLHSSGKVICDPDYLVTYQVTKPVKH